MNALAAALFGLGIGASALALPLTTISDRYQWLETTSSKRTNFITDHNRATDNRQKADPNYANIEYWLFQLYDVPSEHQRINIDSDHSVSLIERGLGKPTELVLDSPEGETLILSNEVGLHSSTRNIINFGLSPDKKLIYAVLEEDGSIDQVQVKIYDLVAHKFRGTQFEAAENSIAWISPSALIFPTGKNDQDTLSKYDVLAGKTTTIKNGFFVADGVNYVLFSNGKDMVLHQKFNQSELIIQCEDPMSIAAEEADAVDVWCNGDHGLGEIRRFSKSVAGTQAGQVLVPQSDQPIRAVTAQDHYLFLLVRSGANRWVRIYDLAGPQLGQIPVPNCCSMSLKWASVGKILTATMTSAVGVQSGFNYDLATATWDRDPNVAMMNSGGVIYKTEIVNAISHDGTQVPVRITRRSDIKADGSHPVYVYTYGGFSAPSRLDPVYYREHLEFLKRGGILADPGVRGGNEFGPAWHAQATHQNKINTYYDLVAAARLMVQLGWTVSEKVISTGTSNGGLTVAATALLFPESFGLIIPISGVHDLLGKERMDAKNDGWDYEYGSALDAAMRPSLTAISPLENVGNLARLRFLILDGIDDTRVNPAHSLKLAAALQDLGGAAGNVDIATFKDSGHWLADFYYQNSIAWHANVLVWTKIFDQAGWKW